MAVGNDGGEMTGGQWRRGHFWQGILLLVLLITLFLAQPLFRNRPLLAADLLFHLDPLWQPLAPPGYTVPANQILSDQVFEFYPWQKFVRAELAQGRLPLWNPYVNSGHPLLANAQSAPFDPFNVVALLWPLAKSFVGVAFLRLLVTGTFMLLLALEMGQSRFAAYLAMIVFTFALPQIVWLLYPKASALVWLPAILFLTVRLIRTGKWRYVSALALAMAAQLAGGHPETSLYSALVWLAFGGYCLWVERSNAGLVRRAVVQLGAAGLLGVGAGAAQWLPVSEALLHSEILASRSQAPLAWQTIFFQWREWLAALTMLMPDFFGNPRHHDYWYPYSNYTEQTMYVGILPLALAVVVFVNRGRARNVGFFAALAILSLGFSLRLPLFPLLAELPGLSITNSGRLRAIYMLAMALLAGYGLDLVRQGISNQGIVGGDASAARPLRLLTRILLALGTVAALAAAGAYLVVTQFYDQLVELGRGQVQATQGNPFFFLSVEEYLRLAEARVQQMAHSFTLANLSMYLPLMVAIVVLVALRGVCHWVRMPQRRAQATSMVLVVLVVGELWLFGVDYNPTVAPEQVFPVPELVDALLQQSATEATVPFRVAGTGLTLVPNVAMVFGLEDVRGYDPIASRRYMALMNGIEGTVRVGHHLLLTHADAPFWDFLNVRYLFAAEGIDGRWTPLRTSDGVTLYANAEAMPRASMVYAGQRASSPEESLTMTLAPDFDFRNSVVLEGVSESLVQSPPSLLPQVEVTAYAPGSMSAAVTTAAAGFLVVSDPYTPGWVASVDGTATEILVANHAFRAVAVGAGNHSITFHYQPATFVTGATISGISLALLLFVLIVGRSIRKL